MTIPAGFELVPDLPPGFELADDDQHLEVINGLPTYVKGKAKEPVKKKYDINERAVGLGEAALQAGSGAFAGVVGPLAGLVDRVQGRSNQEADARVGEAMHQFTYAPRSELGQEYGETGMNALANLLPLAPIHLPNVGKQFNSRLARQLPEAFKPVEIPKGFEIVPDAPVKPPVDPAGQMQLFAPDEQGKAANLYGAAEGVWRTDENGIPIRADLSMDAQNAGAPLQRNLFGDQLEPTRNPVGQSASLFDQNGMQESIPITEAMDNMGWAQRRGAINSQLRGAVEPTGALDGAILEANQTAPRELPKGQRGAINMEVFDPSFKVGKELDNGVKLLMVGRKTGPVVLAFDPQGKRVGEVAFGRDNFLNEINAGKDNLEANWVTTDPAKTAGGDKPRFAPTIKSKYKGLAADMYKFAAEQGNDIVASTAQTPEGQMMWKHWADRGFSEGMRIPSRMRGAFDYKHAEEVAKRMRAMVEPEKITTKAKPVQSPNEAMPVPGLSDAIKNHIPKDPDVGAVREAILKEGGEDGKIILKNFRAGATMVGDQRKSALITAAGRYVQNGMKRAEKAMRDIVQPVEKDIARMSDADTVTLAGLLKEEMLSGRVMDEATVAELSPKQQAVYKGMRDMQNAALERQNAARVALGLEPITAREGYMASRWGGRFRVPVYDKAGKLVWYIAETSKRSALKALDYLESKAGIDVDRSKSTLEIRGAEPQYQKNNRGYLEDSYLNMLSVLDKDDPRVAHVRSIMEDAMGDKAYDSLGQAKHFEPKAGVRGFLGDRPWLSGKANAYDMLKAQMAYAKNAFKWSESQQAVSSIKQLLADKDIQASQPNNAAFVRDYVKNHLGYGEDALWNSIENRLSTALGYDRSTAAEGINMAKSVFLMQKLALNIGYYASQGLQMLNSIPEHGYLTGKGYKHNMLKTLALSQADFGAGLVRYQPDILNIKNPTKLKMSKLGEDAWDYMHDNGISNRNIMDEAGGLGEHPVFEQSVNAAGSLIALSEKFLRTNTFLQMAHHLDQSGKFKTRSELFQAAEEATNKSMVDFRREERAPVFAKLGLVGSAASTLKSYLVNYYNNMGRYGQEAMNGKPRALLYALGLQGALYGVLNLPGMQEVNDIWESLKKTLPDDVFKHVKDVNLKKLVIEHLGDSAAYGNISTMSGVNLANRGSIAVDQQFALDGLFPFISDLYKQGASVGNMIVNPNETTADQALYNMAPSGPLQGMQSQTNSFKVGENEDGTTTFVKPTKLTEHEHNYDRTPDQIAKKNWGFTDLEEARTKDLKYSLSTEESAMAARRDQNVTKAFDALQRHDDGDFVKAQERYMDMNGDPDKFMNELLAEAYKMNISRDAITAIKNNPSLTDLQRLQKLVEVVGKVK